MIFAAIEAGSGDTGDGKDVVCKRGDMWVIMVG